MGHYDSDYDHAADVARKRSAEKVKKARKLLIEALDYDEVAAYPEQYKIKIKEAILWLEESV